MPVNYTFKYVSPTTSTIVYSFDDVFVPIDLFSLGDMLSWGYNGYGQLGVNDTNNRSSPVILYKNNFDVKKVSAGFDFVSIIRSDGTLWTWGNGGEGKLGDGSENSYSYPIQISSEYVWKDISCGYDHMGAITKEGHLYMWGRGTEGQLGIANETSQSTPVREYTESKNWVSISCGKRFSFGLQSNNTLWSWGFNADGQLGNGSTTNLLNPMVRSGTWKQVSAGESHTAAISTNGTLWSCGKNTSGQLGDGTTTSPKTSFAQVGSVTTWKQVSCGAEHTIAIRTDGTMWACGSNFYGQLGIGSEYESSTSLVQVGSGIDWKQVYCGLYVSIAIKTDGSLWVWGNNPDNTLGINNGANSKIYTPTELSSVSNIKQVSAGNSNFYAIRYQNVYI